MIIHTKKHTFYTFIFIFIPSSNKGETYILIYFIFTKIIFLPIQSKNGDGKIGCNINLEDIYYTTVQNGFGWVIIQSLGSQVLSWLHVWSTGIALLLKAIAVYICFFFCSQECSRHLFQSTTIQSIALGLQQTVVHTFILFCLFTICRLFWFCYGCSIEYCYCTESESDVMSNIW